MVHTAESDYQRVRKVQKCAIFVKNDIRLVRLGRLTIVKVLDTIFDTEYGYRVTDATYRESSKSVQCCEANIICQGLLKSCQGMTFFCEGLRKSCQGMSFFCEGL